MSVVSRTTLKTYFETGDKPTQSNFVDLIDSFLSLGTSASQTVQSDVVVSGSLSVTGSLSLANISTGIVSASTLNSTGGLKVDGAATIGTTLLVGSVASLNGPVAFGSTVNGFYTAYNNQVGTNYVFTSSDAGKTVTFNNAAAVSAMLPNNMGLGFTCEVIQLGAGQVSFFTNSGATLQNRSSQSKIAGQYGAARLSVVTVGAGTSATYNLAGDTA